VSLAFTKVSQANIDTNKLEKISELLVSYEQLGRFSGSISIKKGDEIIYEHSNGFANKTDKVNNASDKIFAIASVSKQFTATAVLLLAQQGKLSLDDSISKYLPYYQNEVGQKTTIYHLLTHTAGIPDPMDMGNGIDGKNDPIMKEKTLPIKRQNLINTFKDLPSLFMPGSRYEYSNTGYILLADVIEQASGQSYDTFLQRNIFDPAGMTNTSANKPDNNPLLVESYSGLGNESVHTTKLHNSWLVGGSGIYSTTQDLFKWVDAMNNHKILKDKNLDYLLVKPVDLGRNNEFYGYGMEMKTLWGEKVYRHDGATVGTISDFLYFPENELTIVIYINHVHNVNAIGYSIGMRKQIIQQVSGILFDQDIPVTLAKEITKDALLQQYVGRYVFDKNHGVEITLNKNNLQLTTIGKTNWSLYNLAQVTHLPSDTLTDKSTDLFNLLNINKLDGLAELFDKKMASAPTSMFSNFWKQLESELGSLEDNYSFAKTDDNSEIQQRLVFDKGIVDMAIFFNNEGRIKGIQNSSPIAKDNVNSFTTTLLTQKDDQLLIDGYVMKKGDDLFLKFTRDKKNQISGFSYNQMGEHQAVKQ
jgi:CubicO group peptidase (beta-lactamase class C family)